MDSIGGRKFLIGIFVLVVATALLWAGKLDQTNWVDLLKWTVVGYLAANASEYAADALINRQPPAP